MSALQQFFSMGGYGAYVWPAYIIAAVVLLALLVDSLRGVHQREAQLAALRRARHGDPGAEA